MPGASRALYVAMVLILAAPRSTRSFVPSSRRMNGASNQQQQQRTAVVRIEASVTSGDTVLVVGGTSGIGQLVTQKLAASGVRVKATSRNKERGEQLLLTDETTNNVVQVVELDLLSTDTTPLKKACAGAKAVVISVGTTAFPTLKWNGGNTPQAIDRDAVTRLAHVLADEGSSVEKVILVTSVGVDRTGEMPFLILNAFGVLDAKKAGEMALKEASTRGSGFEYVIVRPGRLVGGPFTNLDVAKLLQIQGGAENGVDTAPGDSLLGDCKRDACAECIVQCLVSEAAKNLEFSIVSNEKKALTSEEWTVAFQNILGASVGV